MGGWSGVYTQKGRSLLARLTQGQSLAITRAVVGTGVVAENKLNIQTAVTGIKQELSFQTPSYPEVGACKLPAFLNNIGLTVGYTAHQIGVYVKDTDGAEILYYICQSTKGTEIPAESELPGYAATWTFYFKYGNADNITVTVNPANAVTYDMLEEVRIIAESGVAESKYGNCVVINNTANLPFSALSIYGKSTQKSTPTPDSPVDIEPIDGIINVDVYGKNLLKVEPATANGVTLSKRGNFYVLNGTATASHNFVTRLGYLPAGEYSISANNPTNNGIDLAIVDVHSGSNAATLQVLDDKNYNKKTMWLPESTDYVSRVRVENGITYNNYKIQPQLELNSVATGYEPYTKQTTTVSITTGLHGIYDAETDQWIKDEVDLSRGLYIQRLAVVDLSTLNWTRNTSDDTIYWWVATVPGMKYARFNTELGAALAEKYNIRIASGMSSSKTGQFAVDVDNIKVNTGNSVDKPTGNLLYCLETPVETGISVDSLHSNNPTTTIINDSNAEMYAECIKKVNENAFNMPSASSAFVNLAVSGWTGSDPSTQTVSVPGLAAGANIVVAPDPASFTAYAESGVYCASQSEESVTFVAEAKPTVDLKVNILTVR